MRQHSAGIRICLTVLFISFATGFTHGQEVDYNALLVEVLEGYQNLIAEEPDGDEESVITIAWSVVAQAIQNGHLRFSINPDSKGLLQGAWFSASPDKEVTYVIISHDLLGYWSESPATVYGVIATAFQDAATFFLDPPAWGAARLDLMDRLLIKIGNYAAHAELIQKWLLPQGYMLSSYDTYILDSYEQDNLSSVLLFLDRFSLPVLQGLYQIRLAYEENNDSQALRETLLEFGEKLLESRNEVSDDADTVFPLAVAVHSWLEFTPTIIARIHNKERPEAPLLFDQILDREEEYADLRRSLENSRIKDFPVIKRIAKEVEDNFDSSLN